MALYFDILPLDLRMSLLHLLPESYIMGPGHGLEFADYVFDIFELESFQCCDNDYFWAEIYSCFGSYPPHNKSYKEDFKETYVYYISDIESKLCYAARNGHDKTLEYIFAKYPDIIFDYDGLFLVTAQHLHKHCMKLINQEATLDIETYRTALDNAIHINRYGFDDLYSRIEKTIAYLIRKGAIFPNIDYNESPPKFGRTYLDYSLVSKKFIKFIVKYSSKLDTDKFLKYLIVNNSNDAGKLIKCFVMKSKIPITSDLFEYAIKFGTSVTVSALLECNYYPTRQDMKFVKQNPYMDNAILEYYNKKSLKRKRV